MEEKITRVMGLDIGDSRIGVAISDPLTLRNNFGGISQYRVVDRQLVDVYAIEVLGQRRAGLTLVLLGGNDENASRRRVIWAVPTQIGEEVTEP